MSDLPPGMPDDFDLASIGAAISEGLAFPQHRLVLGIQHRDDAGLRVCAWDGAYLRHMSPAKARRTAKELSESPAGAALRPVIDGMNKLADRCDELALASAPTEGAA